MIRRLAITAGAITVGLCLAPPVSAQSPDVFREAAPAPAPVERPRAAPQPEREPELPPAVAAAPAPTYDGTYRGWLTVMNKEQSTNSNCGNRYHKAISIQSWSFSLVYNEAHNEILKGTVSADGTVSAFGASASGGNKLTGKIQGNVLTGEVTSSYCTYSVQLTKG